MPARYRTAPARTVGGSSPYGRISRKCRSGAAPFRPYRRATVFAYPSLGEGFGLPVLEAMTAGVPVLTSDRSSLADVAGGAARLVDPEDTDAIRDGLAALLRDAAERDGRAAAGRERAREFSWDATARATLAALERIA